MGPMVSRVVEGRTIGVPWLRWFGVLEAGVDLDSLDLPMVSGSILPANLGA
jgi:hypothetical protein